MGETGVLRFLTKVTKTQQKGCHTPAANGQRLQHTGSIGQVQGESQSHRTLMTGLGIISQDYYYIIIYYYITLVTLNYVQCVVLKLYLEQEKVPVNDITKIK